MHRVTVNLSPKASDAMERTAARLGLTWTDVINRALQAYAILEEERAAGADVLLRAADGEVTKLLLL